MTATLLSAVRAFLSGNAFQMSAALSYYSLLSIAPLLIVVTGIAGVVFDESQVRHEVVTQMNDLVGQEGAEVTETIMQNMAAPEQGALSMVLGAGLMLLGATTIFAQLQKALNQIWKVEPRPGNALTNFLKQRLLSLAVVTSVGFLLLISLVASAGLSGLQGFLDARLPGNVAAWRVLNFALSLFMFTLLFALIYQIMPDVKIAWRDTWLGALITAVLFAAGKFAIGLYLGQASIGSVFGAAGSLVVFMVWVYYASLILFFGAEITRAMVEARGAVVASEHARRCKEPAADA